MKKSYAVTDELRKIYEEAGKEGIWLREWSGYLAAAGYMKEIESLEKKIGREIDISELTLGDCVNLSCPGSGKTREEACRNAIKTLKGNSRRKKLNLDEVKEFFDPHPGLAGATIPIPARVKKVADKLNGKKMSLRKALAAIRRVAKGKVSVYMDNIMLWLGKPGEVQYHFRVIRFR